MKAVLVNYNYVPTWLLDSNLDYHIFDRSDSREYLKDFPQERITYTENVGNVDYDKLGYLVDNYDNLPDVFLWGKTNLFKYISEEEYKKVANNKTFTPLLTQNHPVYSDKLDDVCYYENGMYYERIDLNLYEEWRYFRRNRHFLKFFGLSVIPYYLPFAPGGNYILTKEVVHRYSKEFYATMRSVLGYARLPGEAHYCERAYYLMWK